VVYNAIVGWAAEEFRSTNAQIEFLLRHALVESGRIRTARRALDNPAPFVCEPLAAARQHPPGPTVPL
jgi:hypothetical protein